MHPALYLEEVVSDIAGCLCPKKDSATLQALATTNRALSEAALDVIWEDVGIWDLAQRMDTSIWTIIQTSGEYDFEQNCELVSTVKEVMFERSLKELWQELASAMPIGLEQLGKRFLRYARRVRALTINEDRAVDIYDSSGAHRRVDYQVSLRVISLWAAHGSLLVFPRLQQLVLWSPPFGDPWDLQVILDLINGRPSFTGLELSEANHGSGFCGEDLHVSTPLIGSFSLTSIPSRLFDSLLHTTLSSAERIEWVHFNDCITVDAIQQLALLPSLQSLSIAAYPSSLTFIPIVPPGGFQNLEYLDLQESGVFLWNLFLATEANERLSDLAYHYSEGSSDRVDTFPRFCDIARFVQHAGVWTTLTSLTVSVAYGGSNTYHSSINESRQLFGYLHSLNALARLHISTNIHLPITAEIVGDLLQHCPALDRWFIDFDNHGNVSEPVSFGELYHAVQGHRVGRLPVRLRCNTLPRLDEVHKFNSILLDCLSVHEIGDPTELAVVLVNLFPNLDDICVENNGLTDDLRFDEDSRKAGIALGVIEAFKNAR
jgi:hypothetical protein